MSQNTDLPLCSLLPGIGSRSDRLHSGRSVFSNVYRLIYYSHSIVADGFGERS